LKQNLFKLKYDIGMALLLVLLFNPGSTTLTFHEIAGVVLGFAMIIHVNINWKRLINGSMIILAKKIPGETRLSCILNIALLLDMLVVVISGLLISKILFPNFRYFTDVNWLPIHLVSTFIGLVIVGIHIGLHWNWILQMGKQSPKMLKLISFQKPSHQKVAKILLVLGTIALLTQMPKQVMLTQAIFSDQALLQESRDVHSQRFADSQEEFSGTKGEEERGRGHSNGFSITMLLGIIPMLIMYSAMLGSAVYYTRLLEKRFISEQKQA